MSQSPMSITQLCNSKQDSALDVNDPDVQLAAEALDDLANAKTKITLPPISTMSSPPSTSPSTPLVMTPAGSIASARQSFSSDSVTFEDDAKQDGFMRRVSNHPFVSTAIRAYESSKASSPMVKYGAEMVESIASPIYGKLGGGGGRSSPVPVNAEFEDDPTAAATTAMARASLNDAEPYRRKVSRDESTLHVKKNTSRAGSRSTSPHRPYTLAPKTPSTIHHHRAAPRSSRWKQLVVHAGSGAGTMAAVISEESLKCLNYCVTWLQYAIRHIEQQMGLLRDVLVGLATGSSASGSSSSSNGPVSNSTTVSTTSEANAAGTLAAIKKEVVDTLRKVVNIISTYAGSGLPEQAKVTVRKFILALPSRWALLNSSTSQSPLTSPSLGPHTSPQIQDTSIKLLNFGSESVEMLQSVSTVFSDSVDRAELWLDRLHSVGVIRRRNGTAAASSSAGVTKQHRRRSSAHAAAHGHEDDIKMEALDEQPPRPYTTATNDDAMDTN
ncbi:transcription factor Opi1-domain-containing protein [Gongronella butleri]|nr:transcription factor Opi1-domain-containing protein [Gongronella butleri]